MKVGMDEHVGARWEAQVRDKEEETTGKFPVGLNYLFPTLAFEPQVCNK